MRYVFLFAAAYICIGSEASLGTIVASWDLDGNTGTETSVAASVGPTGVTGQSITRGSGLDAGSASGTTADGFNTLNWDDGTSNEYVTFGFTVDSGFTVSLDSLLIRTSTTNSGPGTLGLYYNGDSFADAIYTFNQSNSDIIDHSIDSSTSSIDDLTNLIGSVEFRIYQIGDTQADGDGTTVASGAFRLFNHDPAGSIQFNGTVAAIPEAGPMLLGTLVCSLVGLSYASRRWRQSVARSND